MNQLKEKLKNCEFCIYTRYAVTIDLNFIEKFVSQIDWLAVDAGIGLNSTDLKMIAAVLTKSGIKVCLHILFENTQTKNCIVCLNVFVNIILV